MVASNDWKLVGFILGSNYRRTVLLSLSAPQTPKQLSKLTNIQINHVSNILKELSDKGLVECKTPSLKKGRIYALTEKGRQLAEKIKKI